MSAALKPQVSRPRFSDSAVAPQRRRLTVVPAPPSVSAPATFPIPNQADRPQWLRLLTWGQRASFVVAALTVTGALSAYALTVDANRRLTTTTTALGQLQDHHQQLTTANAVFKNHLAQTAIAAVNDGTLHPKDVIFLEATVPAASAEVPPPAAVEAPTENWRNFPKGY